MKKYKTSYISFLIDNEYKQKQKYKEKQERENKKE